VLAHHLTQAGRAEAAVSLWQRAGKLALRRMALSEAISHLNQGLELVATLPPSLKRDTSELELRGLLGTAWMELKGWPTPEVWTSLHPALALAKSLERHDALLPILWGLTNNVMNQGRIAESLPWMEEMLDIARSTGDADLLVAGHALACNCYGWAGEFTRVMEHFNKVLALYDSKQHSHLAYILNHDPKTIALIFSSIATWMLGYPDQALRLDNEKDLPASARWVPLELKLIRSLTAHKLAHRYSYEDLRKACMAIWEASGGATHPSYRACLAEARALTGDLDDALLALDEAIAQIERPGWEERIFYAEVLRLKGWVLSLMGDLEGDERNFLASLDWARRQQAKSFELRTATSLARLWQSQGRRQKAYELLAPVYDWFTEGFDTTDLQEAKVLLAELR
jgi:tetratricopeptide (TPR) repeat protein